MCTRNIALNRFCLCQIKKISVFRVTDLKIIGRVVTHYIFFLDFLCIFMHLSFKMHKIIFFS